VVLGHLSGVAKPSIFKDLALGIQLKGYIFELMLFYDEGN
jgi:hypothetical protein